jgi:hypothetical protein
MVTTFINLYKTLTEAMTVLESPQTTQKMYTGIQLLPNNPLPIVQHSQNPTGIELEDWTVKVYSSCGKLLGDITDYFLVDSVFEDDLGQPQIVWSIKDCPIDSGYKLVYLKITQTIGEDFYSSPFQLTAYRAEFTTRFDYRETEYDAFSSIQLQTWFRQKLNRDEQSNYVEKSTNYTRVKNRVKQRPRKFITERFNNELFETFTDMLENRYLYCELIRCYTFDPFEIPELDAQQNFSEAEYLLTFIPTDTYDPLYVAPVPVPPAPGDELIIRATAYKRPGLTPAYRIRFEIDTVPGYDVVIFGQSYVTLNDVVLDLNPTLTNIVDNTINTWTVYTSEEIIPGQVHLGAFNFRVTEGVDSLDYQYTTPVVIFTSVEIANGIEKEVESLIVEV